MSIALTKTRAEQGLSHNFEAVAARLPGTAAVAAARKAAIGLFAAHGLPHRRIEQWKWTDLRSALKEALPPSVGPAALPAAGAVDAALEELASLDAYRMTFIDGVYAPGLSRPPSVAGVEVEALAALLKADADLAETPSETMTGQESVVALNTAFMTDGAVVRIGERVRLDKPLLIVLATAARDGRLTTTRNALEIGAGAEATVIEAHVALPGSAPGQANTLSRVTVGAGATLTHIKCTLAGERGQHLATWLARIGKDASYRAFQLTASSGLVRDNHFVTFAGQGARLDISGAFLGRGSEHIDTTLVVDHAVPRCTSRELFKGVLADQAHGIFQGRVIVRPDAQKSDGKQMAQVLMLSPDAEFDSKPELEIHADDVVCGHGATVAEIDPDMLFYLRARGIPVADARALLIESFIGEAIDKVADDNVRAALSGIAKRRLAGLSAPQA